MELNLTSAFSGGKGRTEPREAQSPVGNLNSGIPATLAAGVYTVEAKTFLAQTGDFTLPVRPQEWSEDRGMLRDGGARKGVTPALGLPATGHPV